MALRFCEVCKQEIENERAEHLPETRLCVEHARQIQDFGGEFRVRELRKTQQRKQA